MKFLQSDKYFGTRIAKKLAGLGVNVMKLCGICKTCALIVAALICKAALAAEPVGVAGASTPTRSVTEFAKITPSDGYPVAFGASIAASGDDLVVGAPGYITEDGVVGTAYVFHRVGPKWIEIGKLRPEFEGIDGEDFGLTVAIEGDYIVVGAPHIIGGVVGGGYGRAFIFRRDDRGTPDDPLDDQWWQDAELRTPDEIRFGDLFGRSVAISDGVVLIGRPGSSQTSGSAYLYRRMDNVWRHVGSLNPSDATYDDRFGDAVSLSAGFALVGAPHRSDFGIRSGAAYAFREIAGAWVQESKLTAKNAAAFDFFGNAVSLAHDTAVVGAQGQDVPASGAGAAYVFVKGECAWSTETQLLGGDTNGTDGFGQAVATNGHWAVIGAPGKEDASIIADHVGATYLFRRDGARWSEQRKLTASDPRAGLVLGASTAVGKRYAFAGAQEVAYVYVLPDASRTLRDSALMQTCFRDEERGLETECVRFDLIPDDLIDYRDFIEFLARLAGP